MDNTGVMLDPGAMPERIERWLAAGDRPATVVSYQLMTGGYSRVMARVELAHPDGTAQLLVMRGDPPDGLQTLVTDRDAEWAVLSWLGDTKVVPSPLARWYEADRSWFGTKAIFLDHHPGHSVQSALEAGADRSECGIRLCDLMRTVGAQTPDVLPATMGRPTSWDDYVDEKLAGWHAIADNHVEALPTVRYLASWLDAHRPEPAPFRLVHGDLQPSNILVGSDGDWHLIDWEYAHVGDPREEIGYYLAYTQGVPPNVIGDLETFLTRYRMATGLDDSIVNPVSIAWWTTVSTLAVVRGLHDGIAGLARNERHGAAACFNTILVTVGYESFMASIERMERAMTGAEA